MRPVANLASRRALKSIQVSLEETGHARCDLVELDVDVDEWRALARQSARDLGRPAVTFVGIDEVAARLKDWPRDDEEQARTLKQLRRTIEAIQGRETSES